MLTTEKNWRSDFAVLVPEAHAAGGVAVIRSLGRAGYPVHAFSTQPDAIGLYSTYATKAFVSPDYNSPEFLPWLREYVEREQIRCIVPSEKLLFGVEPAFGEFSRLLPIGPTKRTVYEGMSKYDLFASLQDNNAPAQARANLAPTVLIESRETMPSVDALSALGFRLYVKVDRRYARGIQDGKVYPAASGAEAEALVVRLLNEFRRVVVQGDALGMGVGAFFLLWRGQLLAEFMNRHLHEVPYTGGWASLRDSWVYRKIRDDALVKLRYIGWEGVAMMEYRWEPLTHAFHLIEMNGRFWASLHLDLHAGVDFPLLLVDAFHGRTPGPVTEYPVGVRCRYTFPMEVGHVWSKIKDPKLKITRKLASVLEFGVLCLDPRVKSDMLFPRDNGLFVRSLYRLFRDVEHARRREGLTARACNGGQP
ncbi:MAG: hypothetical protein ACREYE_33485 [Gammaproteobacteria bacterium]